MNTRVKVCCISSIAEAKLAVSLGAHALGLVSEMPSGPGVIPLATIAAIAAVVPPHIQTFLLTSKQDCASIVAQQRAAGTNTLQLCDALNIADYQQLRATLPAQKLVQVIHVQGASAVIEAINAAPHVDALLLDSGNTSLAVKELGGTGRTHDWSVSAQIVAAVELPVYLAGGLNAHNVAGALEQVRPYGLDLCSSVRTDDRLDEQKLGAFMAAVSAADG